MNWMVKWAGSVSAVRREAQGAHFVDVDGHRYTDFCLGDTGAMTGHSCSRTVRRREQCAPRHHAMLPGEDSIFVAEETAKALQLAVLAVRADCDRCESLLDPAGAANYGAGQKFWYFNLLLSRHVG